MNWSKSYFRRMRGGFRFGIFCFALLPTFGCRSSVDELRIQAAFAIQNGLDFVAASQTPTGGFVTDSWRVDNPKEIEPVDATFTASQILFSLSFCTDSATARGTCNRAVAYLLAQQQPGGLFSYYGKATAKAISPDVDDTSLAWASLKRYGQSIPRETLSAVRANMNDAGVLNTWIGGRSTLVAVDTGELDAVVNSNALLMFGSVGETIDSVCKFVLAQAESEQFRNGSPYYESPVAFTYAFSRAYTDGGARCLGVAAGKIRAAILSLQKPDGGWGDDLETAEGVITLLNIGYRGDELDRGIRAILARQSPEGGWALTTVYRGIGVPMRYGARSITTAACIEALTKYSKQ
jgi:Prenyltransferase and squalene oxidase repeat